MVILPGYDDYDHDFGVEEAMARSTATSRLRIFDSPPWLAGQKIGNLDLGKRARRGKASGKARSPRSVTGSHAAQVGTAV